MQTAQHAGMTPVFYVTQVEDKKASREAGRPIFKDEERVEYRLAGNRNFNPHMQAHEFHAWENGEEVTHAMRWPEAYKKFKETGGNEANGTPLQNLPGLTPVQMSTLKALSVFTIEALAGLEGQGIKNLGPQGHEMRLAAQKYLAAAGGRVEMTEVMAELAALKARNEELARMVQVNRPQPIGSEPEPAQFVAEVDDLVDADPYAGIDDAGLKDMIEAKAGSRPRGNPNRASLLGMLRDLGED